MTCHKCLSPSRRLPLVGLLLVAWVCLAPASAARAQSNDKNEVAPKDSPRFLAAFRDAVARASLSTVRIQSDGKNAALGVVVSADGLILTKASELLERGKTVLKAKTVCKFKDNRSLEARAVGYFEQHDLLLLKVDADDLTPVQWQPSKVAPVGNWVAAVGLGKEPLAVGVVGVAARTVKLPNSGYLGIMLAPVERGVKISQVMPKTGASQAGLKANDQVLSVAGKLVSSPEALMQALESYKPGDLVGLRVKRGDEELEFKAKLGKRPPDSGRSDFQNRLGSTLSDRRDGFKEILQHDTVVNRFDCGGPLVDLDGNVIGINICRWGRTETYALPSEVVQPLLPQMITGKLALPAPTTTSTPPAAK
jgi:serine protease Do